MADRPVWGRDPLDWGPDYYQRIGVSFELPNHYLKLTGAENLRFFASLYEGDTLNPRYLLEAVGLGDAADIRVGQYSKGMQKIAGVAHIPFLGRPKPSLSVFVRSVLVPRTTVAIPKS